MIKRWIKTAPALLLAVLLCVCAPALETGEACALLQTERDAYVEYLLSLSLSNGAIALYRPTVAQYPSSAPEALDGVPAETYLRWRSAKLEPSRSDGGRARAADGGRRGERRGRGVYRVVFFASEHRRRGRHHGIDGTVYDTYFFIEDGDRRVCWKSPAARCLPPNTGTARPIRTPTLRATRRARLSCRCCGRMSNGMAASGGFPIG